jgi:hypothetical protein
MGDKNPKKTMKKKKAPEKVNVPSPSVVAVAPAAKKPKK